MSARRARRWTLVALAGVLLAGCGGSGDGPASPAPPPPAWIAEVSPAAQSSNVLDDAAIWVRFARDPDPASLGITTVYLKIDTRRVAVTLAWDAPTRTLHIHPVAPVEMRRTYTVELSPDVRDANGERIGTGYWWQFTTNSLRHVRAPSPGDGADDASPLTALHWNGLTEAAAGDIAYEVRTGTDSASALAAAGFATTVTGRWYPDVRWSQQGPVWWSVTAVNHTTGERLAGPAWRFTCLPVSTPVESLDVPLQDWSWQDKFGRSVAAPARCSGDTMWIGPGRSAYYRWMPGPADSTVRLADARIEVRAWPLYVPLIGPDVTVWPAGEPWAECTLMRYPGPPYVSDSLGALSGGEALADGWMRLDAPRLGSHIETTLREGLRPAWFLRAPQSMGMRTGFGVEPQVRMRIFRYRRPPRPAW